MKTWKYNQVIKACKISKMKRRYKMWNSNSVLRRMRLRATRRAHARLSSEEAAMYAGLWEEN